MDEALKAYASDEELVGGPDALGREARAGLVQSNGPAADIYTTTGDHDDAQSWRNDGIVYGSRGVGGVIRAGGRR